LGFFHFLEEGINGQVVVVVRLRVEQELNILNQCDHVFENPRSDIKVENQILIHLGVVHQEVKPVLDQIPIEVL
jgi:hypothetical protein